MTLPMMSRLGLGVFLYWAACYVKICVAGDLASEVRQGVSSPTLENGGYVELGAMIRSYVSPLYGNPEGNRGNAWHTELNVSVNGRYQYRRFFVESFSESLEQFTLGYNAINHRYWALDIVGLQEHSRMSEEESDDFKIIHTRKGDFTAGLRSTWYWQPYIVQLHLLTDISDVHDGEVYSLRIARNWLYRNWNFHCILGATYRSENVADYYFSVHPAEASETFPQYAVQAGTTTSYEVGATYPISEKWVFRALIRHIDIPSQWRQSPLFVGDYSDEISTSFNYVF